MDWGVGWNKSLLIYFSNSGWTEGTVVASSRCIHCAGMWFWHVCITVNIGVKRFFKDEYGRFRVRTHLFFQAKWSYGEKNQSSGIIARGRVSVSGGVEESLELFQSLTWPA